MDKLRNKAARRYLRHIRGLLPCSRRLKDEIAAPLLKSLDDFLTERPDADMEALLARFGAPESIAASCLACADQAEVLRKLQTKRRITTIIVAAVIVVLLSWGCFLFGVYHKLQAEVLNGHNVISMIVSEDTSSSMTCTDAK